MKNPRTLAPEPLKRTVWAIADLHLSLSTPEKSMSHFGPKWERYTERIEDHWRASIGQSDLVAIAGDISWAMRLDSARADFQWLDSLPGTKILLRGNHDYWWATSAQMGKKLPPSCRALTGPALQIGPVAFAGSRLWQSREISCDELFEPGSANLSDDLEESRHRELFERELRRLERSLQTLPQSASHKIALTHFPPIGPQLNSTRASRLLEKWGVDWALFGHLHGARRDLPAFGVKNGVHYALTSADFLNFAPRKLFEFV